SSPTRRSSELTGRNAYAGRHRRRTDRGHDPDGHRLQADHDLQGEAARADGRSDRRKGRTVRLARRATRSACARSGAHCDRQGRRPGAADRKPARRAGAAARDAREGASLMDVLQQLLPYIGWVIAGAVVISLGGILASVHNTRLKIKNGYPIEGMWGQSL